METDQATLGAASAHVRGAGNEVVSFQLVVSGASSLDDVHVGGTLTSACGVQLPDASWQIYREEYVSVTTASTGTYSTVTAAGRYPDPLIPAYDRYIGGPRNAFPVAIPQGENRSAWIDVFIPPGTAPGDYAGSVAVVADGTTVQVPVTVTVLNWTLPATASLMSHWGLGDEVFTVPGVTDPAEQERLLALFALALLDHRASARTLSTGAAEAGTALFDQYVVPLMTGTAATLVPGAANTVIAIQPDLNGSTVDNTEIANYAAAASANGFGDRLEIYQWDEPADAQLPGINQATAAAHAADASIHTAGAIDTGNWSSLSSDANWIWLSWDYFANTLNTSPDAGETWALRDQFDPFLAASVTPPGGNRLGVYTSQADTSWYPHQGLPSFVIDALDWDTQSQSVGAPARASAWLCFDYGLQGGLLDWSSTHFLPTAWDPGGQYQGGTQNGDGNVLYPGLPGQSLASGGTLGGAAYGPIVSIRLKQHRNGFQDYEYLLYLSQHGADAQAHALVRALFPTVVQTWVTDDALQAQRIALEDAVIALLPP